MQAQFNIIYKQILREHVYGFRCADVLVVVVGRERDLVFSFLDADKTYPLYM